MVELVEVVVEDVVEEVGADVEVLALPELPQAANKKAAGTSNESFLVLVTLPS